jgi:hypothetical protein
MPSGSSLRGCSRAARHIHLLKVRTTARWTNEDRLLRHKTLTATSHRLIIFALWFEMVMHLGADTLEYDVLSCQFEGGDGITPSLP